ncbi:MAG TPA: hypothetical protein DIT07_11435 [Sphingobacteriaceae bacterium]|nr:hypothetical protein [Sphingobacteriaceae bacterium]
MEWILLKTTLPEQGKDVLLYDGGQIYFGYYSEIYENFIVCDDKVKVEDFTYWMPLPQPPK